MSGNDRGGAPPDREAFARARGRWLQAIVGAADLSDADVRVGAAIVWKIGLKRGYAFPTVEALAAELHCGTRKVERSIAVLLGKGWLIQLRRGRAGVASEYTLDWPKWTVGASPRKDGGRGARVPGDGEGASQGTLPFEPEDIPF